MSSVLWFFTGIIIGTIAGLGALVITAHINSKKVTEAYDWGYEAGRKYVIDMDIDH